MSRFLLTLFWCLACCFTAQANTLQFSIAQWQLDEFIAQDLLFEFDLTADGLTARAQAQKITLPAPINELLDVSLDCQQLELWQGKFICQQGKLSFYQQHLGEQKISFKLDADYDREHYQIAVKNLRVANSRMYIDAELIADQWQASIQSSKTSVSSLLEFAKAYLTKETQAQLASWQFDDRSAIKLDLAGRGDVISSAQFNIVTEQLSLNDEAGLYAAEAISSTLDLNLVRTKNSWQWQSSLAFIDGQAYADPVFFDFSENKLNMDSAGYWQIETDKVVVNKLAFVHEDIMNGQAKLTLSKSVLDALELTIEQAEAKQLYQHWLQPFAVGTAVDNMTLSGQAAINYRLQEDDYQFSLTANELSADDLSGRFSIEGLTGQLAWTSFDQPVESQIGWQSANVYAVSLGRSDFKASVSASQLQLLESWAVPIFDGQLQINTLQLNHKQSTNWTFDGLVTPVSMELLSEALDWPTLHGKLSGVIPKVSYHNQNIAIDGALMVKLFEGTTIIRDLRLERPFGTIPQLYGNIDLVGLDLETITKTFEFGKITGRLDGKVENLRLSNWQPVHFDARIATPAGDKSKRRISQQAIDNLSQLGGGATGILSKSFLRFFEDFSYQKIGLSCKLRNEVCTISGVEEKDTAYYIVKGGGLPPRINVMGYTRRVDWPELISRLKAVSSSAGPVVK